MNIEQYKTLQSHLKVHTSRLQ